MLPTFIPGIKPAAARSYSSPVQVTVLSWLLDLVEFTPVLATHCHEETQGI